MAEASCPEDAAAVLEAEYQPLTLRLEREDISHQTGKFGESSFLKCDDREKDMLGARKVSILSEVAGKWTNWKEEVFPENNEFSVAILLYRAPYFGRRWFADQTIDLIPNLTNQIRISGGDVHSLKLTAKAPEHRPQRLRRKWSYSNYIHFQVRNVSFNNGIFRAILILTRSFCVEKSISTEDALSSVFFSFRFCFWKPCRPCWSLNPAKIFWRRPKRRIYPFPFWTEMGGKKREVGWWVVFIVVVDWFKGKIPNCVWWFHQGDTFDGWKKSHSQPLFGCKKSRRK